MSTLDWLIVAATATFAVSGFFRGFIVGALSLVGFIAGAVAGTRFADAVLSSGANSPYAAAFGLAGALLAGGVLATGFEGVGVRLRRAVRTPVLGAADGVLGAALSAAVALGIAWIIGAVVLALPGVDSLRSDVQRSAILRRLDELLPPSGALLHALARVDPLPALGGPVAGISPPAVGIVDAAGVQAVEGSVVRVLGTACGLGIEGSGWVIAPGEVLTNAHVVAGEQDTVVEVNGSPPDLPATPVLFDSRNDLALLVVSGLRLPPLSFAAGAPAGTSGAILGYPHDGPFESQPARIGSTRAVLTQDAYGRGSVSRLLVSVRGLIQPGNSGGPLVDARGQVLTTIFAATTAAGPSGGFGIADSVVAADVAHVGGRVSTGPCAG